MWKVATFNVNGIRARLPILEKWLGKEDPDLLCLQETKCQDKDFPVDKVRQWGYRPLFKGQKSFNGVAMLTKIEPDEVVVEFGRQELDREARLLAARFHDVWIVNSYVPQGRSPDDPAFQYKLGFLLALQSWFQDLLTPRTPLAWMGDINIAPGPEDVFDPERLDGQVGFHPEERRAFREILRWGLVDLLREFHPQGRHFTFWDYRLPRSFRRNLGWRLDHVLVTEPLRQIALGCNVDRDPRGWAKPSDHAPVVALFDLVPGA